MAKQVKLDMENSYSGYAGSAAVNCPYCGNKIQLAQSTEVQYCRDCGSEYTVAIEFEAPPEDD